MSASKEQIAWAAGLFEGEGCINIKSQSLQLHIGMTDRDVLERFHSIVGLGSVCGPYKTREPHHKPISMWIVSGHRGSQAILAAFWNFFGFRRKQKAEEAIRFGAGLQPHSSVKRRCKRGHEFSKENTKHHNGKRICITCRRMHGRNFAMAHKKERGEYQKIYRARKLEM